MSIDKEFSVAICVYGKDNADFFDKAVQSVINQTAVPKEIILVVDGPVPSSIQDVIDYHLNQIDFLKVVYLPENKGYAFARQVALENCSYELIALMDSDDISVNNRFELQLNAFESSPDVSVVGGYITEFVGDINNIFGMRKTPLTPEECLSYSKLRAPINNVTAMYKKKDVMAVGGYNKEFFPEDYYLWVSLQISGYKVMNIPETLCYVRIDGMFNRRGGLKYYRSIKKIYKYMLANRFITKSQYIKSQIVRLFVHAIIPNFVRKIIYKMFARSKN